MKKIEFSELSELLKNFSISFEKLEKKQRLENLEYNWEKIVGPVYKNHSKPSDLRNNKLIIFVENSSYKQEFLFSKKPILNRVKNFDKNIESFQIYIKNLKLKNGIEKTIKQQEKIQSLEGKENLLKLVKNEPDLNIQKKLEKLIQFL